MRVFLGIALLATSAGAQPTPPAKPCHPEAQVAKGKQGPHVQPLGDMPPAKQVLAVYRETNGCTEPVVVRKNVGASGRF